MAAIFTIGNLITLGITVFVIFVVRYMDRQNRSVDLAREYGKRLKDDIAAFAEVKAAEVKDNGLVLDVQKSAVKEALNRLAEANAELAEKTERVMQRLEEVGRIGDRISAYDKSMEELIRMTGRVEENMGRLREESAFVETTARQIGGIKTQAEKLEKDLGGLELRLEKENSAALEKIAGSFTSHIEELAAHFRSETEELTANFRSEAEELTTHFRSEAETVERQVEAHRAAVDRIEAERKTSLERDVGIINKTLGEALERAEKKAGKLEEEALVKYREDSRVRIRSFEEAVEEKFREYRESAKARLEEQKEYQKTWQRDIEALDALALSQQKQWEAAVAETEDHLQRLDKELGVKAAQAEETILKEVEGRLAEYRSDQGAHWKRLETLAEDAAKLDGQLRQSMEAVEAKVRKDFSLFEEERKQEQNRVSAAMAEEAEALKAQMIAVEQELNVLKQRAYDNVSEKLNLLEDDFFNDLSKRGADIDNRLNEWHANLERKLTSLGEEAEAERRSLELSFKEELAGRMEEQSGRILSELERLKLKADAFEERTQNGLDETESRIVGLSNSVEEVRRGLKEFTTQTRLFEKTDELKLDLERSIETLRTNLSGVEEHRTEAAKLETEFIKIRRLEEEVNTKMTRFLTEKSHLDIMERDFERLIQTSQRVEERLKEVTGADDTLQHIQVSLRKLEDAITAAEDKYRRVEDKNRILEETNRGIERNFQILEETEMALRKCRENIDRADESLESLRPSIEELAAASEKAQRTEDKLTALDTNLTTIEDRIEKMQTVREWLAREETRFDELKREAQGLLSMLEVILKDESKKTGTSKGAPPPSAREAVIRLRRQGWGTEEIARAMKIPRGEVELILEMGVKD